MTKWAITLTKRFCPIHLQYEEAMRYLNELLVEKVLKVKGESETVRVWNYPYQALEEVVANAIFHKSWDDRNPIEIRINKDRIEVYNLAGPTPPITNADLRKEKVINRSYRNRRIGDFLKELHITEGRSTGFPKIYRALKKNDSPLPVFETDEHNQRVGGINSQVETSSIWLEASTLSNPVRSAGCVEII